MPGIDEWVIFIILLGSRISSTGEQPSSTTVSPGNKAVPASDD